MDDEKEMSSDESSHSEEAIVSAGRPLGVKRKRDDDFSAVGEWGLGGGGDKEKTVQRGDVKSRGSGDNEMTVRGVDVVGRGSGDNEMTEQVGAVEGRGSGDNERTEQGGAVEGRRSGDQHAIESDDGIDVNSEYQLSDIDELSGFIDFEAQEWLLSAEEDEISVDEGRSRGHRRARSRRPICARARRRRESRKEGGRRASSGSGPGCLSQLMPQRRGGVRIPHPNLSTLSRPPLE